MNKPLAKVGSFAASRAASVSSRAARWPLDIFDVSIATAGSSAGVFWRGFEIGVSIIMASFFRVKVPAALSHGLQKRTRLEVARATAHELSHRFDNVCRSCSVGVAQWAAPEWSEAGAHNHCEIHI